MTQLDVMQWIASKHGEVLEPVAADSISELDDSSVTRIVWKAPNQAKLANAFFLRDNKLIRLTLENIVDGPTFSDVVSNLGSPEWLYRSAMVYDKNVAYTIGLRYPRIGIDVYTTGEVSAGESFIQGQPILPFSSGMHVQKIECYKAGSIQQVMKENFFMSEETISITLQKQMPWPGFTQSHIPYNNP